MECDRNVTNPCLKVSGLEARQYGKKVIGTYKKVISSSVCCKSRYCFVTLKSSTCQTTENWQHQSHKDIFTVSTFLWIFIVVCCVVVQ